MIIIAQNNILFLCYELTFSGLFEFDKTDNSNQMIALTVVIPTVVINEWKFETL
jgi:hypothetical protein